MLNENPRPISGKGDATTSANQARRLDQLADLHLALGYHASAETLAWRAAELRTDGAA